MRVDVLESCAEARCWLFDLCVFCGEQVCFWLNRMQVALAYVVR